MAIFFCVLSNFFLLLKRIFKPAQKLINKCTGLKLTNTKQVAFALESRCVEKILHNGYNLPTSDLRSKAKLDKSIDLTIHTVIRFETKQEAAESFVSGSPGCLLQTCSTLSRRTSAERSWEKVIDPCGGQRAGLPKIALSGPGRIFNSLPLG